MPLRAMTYNIWDGGGDRLPRIRETIRAQQPDVVALEEADDEARLQQLARDLGMSLAYGPANGRWRLAWLSRLPIAHQANYTLPALSKALVQIEVVWEGTRVQLFAAHLGSERSLKGEEARTGEVRAILQAMSAQATSGAVQVLVGDFNTLAPQAVPPPDDGLSQDARERSHKVYSVPRLAIPLVLEAGLCDCYQTQHPNEQGYTFKSWEPVARFDYIFASEPLAKRLLSCDRVTAGETAKGSDHLPVWAEFADPLP